MSIEVSDRAMLDVILHLFVEMASVFWSETGLAAPLRFDIQDAVFIEAYTQQIDPKNSNCAL